MAVAAALWALLVLLAAVAADERFIRADYGLAAVAVDAQTNKKPVLVPFYLLREAPVGDLVRGTWKRKTDQFSSYRTHKPRNQYAEPSACRAWRSFSVVLSGLYP